MQKNTDSLASFNAYYLVNPNNLLTHTHTHTHTHLAHLAFKRLHVRAREERVIPINKGLLGVPFVPFFMPFCQPGKGKFSRIIHSKHSDYETKTIREMGLCEARV